MEEAGIGMAGLAAQLLDHQVSRPAWVPLEA
jgi:hypothetical protein